MSAKDLKMFLVCLTGACLAVGLGWVAYFNAVSAPLSFGFGWSAALDAVEAWPWRWVTAALGVATLCLECLIVKRARQGLRSERLGMALCGTLFAAFVFVILCSMSNDSLIDTPGLVFVLGALASSLAAFGLALPDAPTDKAPSLRWPAAAGLALLLISAGIASVVASSMKMGAQVAAVVVKYEAEFKALGLSEVSQWQVDTWGNKAGISMDLKRGSAHSFGGPLVTHQEAAEALGVPKEEQEGFSNNFGRMTLSLEKGRLRATDLKYKEEEISQEELASRLDIVMSKVVMPQLRALRQRIENERLNRESHES